MPDGDEDSDTDGIPNKEEVENLTNPFDGEDVDPRPYLWNGEDPGGGIDEGDIGYGVEKKYHVVTQPDSQPIVVQVIEGGYMVEAFEVKCDVACFCLNPDDPPTNRFYCIAPKVDETNFWFRIIDGGTTWPNETEPEYGADIQLKHEPTGADLDVGVAEESEESVGFLLADKSAHPEAERRLVQIKDVSGGEYLTNVILTYDTSHLCVYGDASGGSAIPNGTTFPIGNLPDLYAEGIAHSGMREAFVSIKGEAIPVHDRVRATVLKADIGSVGPLADRTLHPDAARKPMLLKQTLPDDWNGLMQLSLSGAVAFWTPTGGVAIVLGETVFTNAQLDKTIYLEGDGCGTGQASFSVVGLSDCVTNVPLRIYGANATLACVAELDEEYPGGFIADRTVHTNAPRTALNLAAGGPSGSSGYLTLTWNSSFIKIYTAPTGGTALAQFYVPFAGFNGTNLYVEGIDPGVSALQWSYSGQSDCEDVIQITVLKVDLKEVSFSGTKYHTVKKDDGSQDYTAPHWQDNSSPLDGDADDAGDKKYPICFTRNTKMTATVKWQIEPTGLGVTINVKGDGPGNLDFPETTATISGNELTITDVECSNPFANEVDFFDPMSITWSFSADGGSTWCNAGTSANQTYVTLGDPLTTVYHTLVHLGCNNANAESSETDVISAVWNDFVDCKIYRVNTTTPLTYYYNSANPYSTPYTLAGLLEYGDGRCGTFAALFAGVLSVQGLTSQNTIGVLENVDFVGQAEAAYTNLYGHPPNSDNYDARDVFFVKNWNLTSTNKWNAVDNPGVEGQGNSDPISIFGDHALVQIGTKIYDPSYGGGPFNNLLEWEDASIDGFGVQFIKSPDYLSVDFKYWIGKEDTKGVAEVITQ